MRKILYYLLLLPLIYSSAWGQASWVATSNAPAHYPLAGSQIRSIEAPVANVLWTLYYEYGGLGRTRTQVAQTGDNGQNWQILTVGSITPLGAFNDPYSGFEVMDLSAINAQMAWMIKFQRLPGLGYIRSSPILVSTTSGPAGFTDVLNVLPADVEKLHFFSATVGIAVAPPATGSSSWRIYRTSDAGATWTAVANTGSLLRAGNEALAAKYSMGSNFWLTTSTGTVLRTADAGLTWSAIANIGKVLAFENDAMHGLAYGSQLLRTTDGGLTWAPVAFSGQASFSTISAIPSLPGTYISGGYEYNAGTSIYTGKTFVSQDYGDNWRLLSTDGTSFNRIVATGPTQIWASTDYKQYIVPYNQIQPLVVAYASGNILATQSATNPASLIAAYPNPTTGLLKLEGPLQANEVYVYDSAGHLCQQGKVSDANRLVDLSRLPDGFYQVVLTTAGGVVRCQRISKQH